MPCRVNRKRLWSSRLTLETMCHASSWFITLTYAPEFEPPGGTLVPRDVQLFLKRLRLSASEPLRYYFVGEYGDRTERPHYHAALFGLSDPNLVEPAWARGHVHIGTLTPDSASYLVSYVTKGLTRPGDSKLGGRHPEFARMSRHPGIGAGLVPSIASHINQPYGASFVNETKDIPDHLKVGPSDVPLGRYLRRLVRENSGYDASPSELSKERLWARANASVLLGRQSVSQAAAGREAKRQLDADSARSRNQISNSRKTL